MEIEELALEFMTLFRGYTGAYGTYQISGQTGAKKSGGGVTIKNPVTQELWEQHLKGSIRSGIGIIPINEDNRCYWGCMDIDKYDDFDVSEFAREVKDSPLVICRSKSGGAHCFLFVKEAIPAELMQLKLKEIAAAYGYSGCEIFPKQVKRTGENDIGNWLNMPYFEYDNTIRYGVNQYGSKLSAEEFINYARRKQLNNAKDTEQVKAEMEKDAAFDALFAEGPPCHEALYKRGIRATEDGRNNSLWSIAQQFKRQRPDDWQELLMLFNKNHCDPPLSANEVKSIINSVKKPDGFYKCKDTCCSQNCDKELCLRRPFGVGSTSELMPKFTGIQKSGGQRDCVWYLTLDTSETISLTTEELLSPAKVRSRMVESLAKPIMLPEVKADAWRKLVSSLLDNSCTIVEGTDDFVEDVFYGLVEEFLTATRTSVLKEDLCRGVVVSEPDGYLFRTQDLVAFLQNKKYNRYSVQQISEKLRSRIRLVRDEDGNAKYESVPYCSYVIKNIKIQGSWKSIRAWKAPASPAGFGYVGNVPDELQQESSFEGGGLAEIDLDNL